MFNIEKKIKIFDSDALKSIHKRIFFSIAVFTIFFSFICFEIFNIMIFSKYFVESTSIKTSYEKNKTYRGKIFDRNGVLLASTVQSYSLYAHPKKISNTIDLSKKLEKILFIPDEKIQAILSKNIDRVWVKRNISPQEHSKIIHLGEIALQTEIEKKRIYPMNEIVSHVVGFSDIDGKGLSGIEKGLQEKLISGKNIYLSVDVRIQNSVRNELIETMNKFSAESGTAIVMDITSGEILAMVNYPDFNPNTHNIMLTQYQFNNATQGLFEMGSTFKPITMAIGLENNIIDEKTLIDVSQPIKISGYTINDFTPYKGKLDIKGIIVKSSNIGAALISKRIGRNNQKEFFKKIGFFDDIKIEIKETVTPKEPNYWGKTETMTIGYGYGLAITPLHLCQAYASIINNGVKLDLTLLKDNNSKSNKVVVKSSTSNQLKKLLRSVILETKYTGPKTKIPGYELGGKTGTAELLYGTGSHRSSFISVFPISKPKYLVYTMITDPKKIKETNFNNTGGWVAAPLVKKIIINMIKILNIPPSGKQDLLKAEYEDFNLIKTNATL